jgi:hypothetical protein
MPETINVCAKAQPQLTHTTGDPNTLDQGTCKFNSSHRLLALVAYWRRCPRVFVRPVM